MLGRKSDSLIGRADFMGKRPADVDSFEGDMASIQKKDRPSMQRDDPPPRQRDSKE